MLKKLIVLLATVAFLFVSLLVADEAIEYDLMRGWNLIGGANVALPSSFFENVAEVIPPIYGHNPTTGDYEATDSLFPLAGFWVLCSDELNIHITDTLSAEGIVYHLLRGWNLIGGANVTLPASDFEDIAEVIPPMFRYNPSTRAYEITDNLIPLIGYWVFCTDDVFVIIEECHPLAVVAGPDTIICDGDEVELRATARCGVPPYEYDWDGSGTFSDGANYTVSPGIGVHSYTVQVRDAEMTVVSDDVTVTVEACGTDCPPIVTDIDGNVYATVEIGYQCWMAENLKTTRYRDGTAIPHITDNSEWAGLGVTETGGYCEYDNNPANVATYGRLYNWYAVDDARGLCPTGWSVPSDDDWKILEIHLGMQPTDADGTWFRGTDQGSQLAGGYDLWRSGLLRDDPAFGTSGFTALPGGHRFTYGVYDDVTGNTYFWSSSESSSSSAWVRHLFSNYTDVNRGNLIKRSGYSVRCLQDGGASSLSVIAEPDTTVCDGDEVELRATARFGVPPYEYDWDGSGTFSDGATYTVSPGIGVHSYTVQVRDAEMIIVSDDVTVTVEDCSSSPTPCPGMPTVTDIDGNVYATVEIGDQCWMAENLKTTHYHDGTAIPHVTLNSIWEGLSTGAYCEYDNEPANVATFGRLYNWYAVDDARGLCPTGWRVPSDGELTTLTSYLGSAAVSQLAGGYDLWRDGDLRNDPAFGTSGFTALPGGYRDYHGHYHGVATTAGFWSSSENVGASAWYRTLYYNSADVQRGSTNKRWGFSVRCLWDE